MITSTKNADYSELFGMASNALGLAEGEGITTLNEYFRNIEALAQIDDKYLILPIDEDTFDINANTRIIKVPDSFKTGVGVAGDQVAEIIFFCIDRYFDAVDLNTQKIYIEWKNAKGDIGLSKEIFRDVESHRDKILFGWALTDKITEQAGQVEFSVRFYNIAGDGESKELIYSFATQPQKILVNKTMQFDIINDDIQILADEVKQMVINRLTNSAPGDKDTIIDPPEFTENLNIANAMDLDLGEDGTYSLRAQAYANGYITYGLYKVDSMGGKDRQPGDLFTYVLTTDTTAQEKTLYYEQSTNEGVSVYSIVDTSIGDSVTGLYEKVGQYTVNSSGTYLIRANTREGVSNAAADSNLVKFPEPIEPQIEIGPFSKYLKGDLGQETVQLAVVPNKELPTDGRLTYTWKNGQNEIIADATGSQYTVTEEDIYTVVVSNTRNKVTKDSEVATYKVTFGAKPAIVSPAMGEQANASDIGLPITITVNYEQSPYDTIVVEWMKKNDGGDIKVAEGIIVYNDEEQQTSASYTPAEGGYYYALLTLSRNNDVYKEKQQSGTFPIIGG